MPDAQVKKYRVYLKNFTDDCRNILPIQELSHQEISHFLGGFCQIILPNLSNLEKMPIANVVLEPMSDFWSARKFLTISVRLRCEV